jgi:hypothetical protein
MKATSGSATARGGNKAKATTGMHWIAVRLTSYEEDVPRILREAQSCTIVHELPRSCLNNQISTMINEGTAAFIGFVGY